MVLVVPYDPEWPRAFERIRARVLAGFEAGRVRVEHVGSTSVPGVRAKPIIDLNVVVATPAEVQSAIDALATLGYEHRGDLGIVGREAFRAPAGAGPAHHLYLVVDGSQAYRDHVDLRDYLRAHPDVAEEYGALKTALGARFPSDGREDRDAYTNAKAEFIAGVLEAARAPREVGVSPYPARRRP